MNSTEPARGENSDAKASSKVAGRGNRGGTRAAFGHDGGEVSDTCFDYVVAIGHLLQELVV